MSELKVGVIGLGRIFSKHLNSLEKLTPRLRLAAVADLKPERTHAFSSLHTGAKSYSSADELIHQEKDLDLVVILTDSGSHFELTMSALSMKTPVMVEKPLALNYEDARHMVEAYEKSRIPLFVVKQNRLNPAVREMVTRIEGGEIGKVNMVLGSVLWCRTPDYYLADSWRMSRETDGGVIWNQASHYVDLMTKILGPIKLVSAIGQNYLSPADSLDSVAAIMESKSGQIGSLVATTTVRPKNFEGSLTVIGEQGLLKVDGHALNSLRGSDSLVSLDSGQDVIAPSVHDVYGESHALVYESVISQLLGGNESQFTARNALDSVRLMEAIDQAIFSAEIVRLA